MYMCAVGEHQSVSTCCVDAMLGKVTPFCSSELLQFCAGENNSIDHFYSQT